jgi:uncharacterized protein
MKSSTLQGRAPKTLRDGVQVIDVDVHAHETPSALIPYFEMPWRKSLELIANVPERHLDIPFFAPQMSVWSPPFPQSGSARRQVVSTAEQMREDLDDLRVDVGVIFPDNLRNTEYAVAPAKAPARFGVGYVPGDLRAR